MTRVILIVVDGCTSRVLGPALDRGELPRLAALAAAGSLNLDCVSVFPSITPAATASIVTGRYPARHGIAGMSWWNPETDDVSYFGDDVWTILQRGIGDFLRGFLLRLNGDRLQAPTMFELAERNGRRAACFNHLIFRGDVPHQVSPPLLVRWLPDVSGQLTVHGPTWLCLGDFVAQTDGRSVSAGGGPFERFGLNDEGTTEFLTSLPGAEALPDFTVAYFADYDFESHDRGPRSALDTLRALDTRLGRVFDAWGGLQAVLDRTCIVLTADHSHSEVGGGDRAAIRLGDVLHGYRCADPASGWRDEDELMLCPNMRAAEVYVRRPTTADIRHLVGSLLEDRRIDQVIWRRPEDSDEFCVATGDRGELRFRAARDASGSVRDEYGARWSLSGDPSALDLSTSGDQVRCGQYPNALERVALGVDHPRSRRLWVTARPGFEFSVAGQQVHHDAGSHGTLHALDSLVPLLVAGHGRLPQFTTTPRIVDAAPLCAELLEIPFDLGFGASHVTRD